MLKNIYYYNNKLLAALLKLIIRVFLIILDAADWCKLN